MVKTSKGNRKTFIRKEKNFSEKRSWERIVHLLQRHSLGVKEGFRGKGSESSSWVMKGLIIGTGKMWRD